MKKIKLILTINIPNTIPNIIAIPRTTHTIFLFDPPGIINWKINKNETTKVHANATINIVGFNNFIPRINKNIPERIKTAPKINE